MYHYLDDIICGISKTGKTIAKSAKLGKVPTLFKKACVVTGPNTDDVIFSVAAQARAKAQQIFSANKKLHKVGILKAIETFKKTNDGDYELLAKILQCDDLVNTNFLHSIINNINPNNRAVVELFLKNPKAFIGKDKIKQLRALNLLLCLNRNNPIPEEILLNPKKQKEFIVKAMEILQNAGKKSSSLHESANVLGYGGRLSRRVKDQVEIASLSANYLDDVENLAHGRDYIQHFEMYGDAMKKAKYGDAFSIKGKMFVREADGKFTELGYGEDVFRELFPPIDRFNTSQGGLGDCYFVSLLDAVMNKPEGRNRIYKMFKGSTRQQIRVSKGEKWPPFLFKRFDKEGLHIQNENAFAILEQFVAYTRAGNAGKNASPEEIMKMFRGGQSLSCGRLLFDLGASDRVVNTFAYNEREIEALVRKGLTKDEAIRQARQNLLRFLENNTNRSDRVITIGTIPKEMAKGVSLLDEVADLYCDHGYSIKSYNPKLQTVTISNPWDTAIETEVSIDTLLKYVNKEGFCCTDISLPTSI